MMIKNKLLFYAYKIDGSSHREGIKNEFKILEYLEKRYKDDIDVL